MKKITLLAAFAIALMSCEKEEIKVNESQNQLRLRSVNHLEINNWQLVETHKNTISTVADSSVWDFMGDRVSIDSSTERLTVIGSYLSVGGEVGFKSTIIKLNANELELLRQDSTVMVFDKY